MSGYKVMHRTSRRCCRRKSKKRQRRESSPARRRESGQKRLFPRKEFRCRKGRREECHQVRPSDEKLIYRGPKANQFPKARRLPYARNPVDRISLSAFLLVLNHQPHLPGSFSFLRSI